MHQPKEYRTLRIAANITSGFGWIIVGIFVLLGFVAGWQLEGLLSAILGGILSGASGIPLVLGGQMVSVFLDQKELLEDIRDNTSNYLNQNELKEDVRDNTSNYLNQDGLMEDVHNNAINS